MTTSQKLGTAELLYERALSMGLLPNWLVPGSLFAISTPVGERFVHDAKGTINSQLSGSLSRNKLATRHILEHRGLPSIACLRPENQAEAEQFLAMHTKIIVKPITGSNSHDVHIVESPDQLTGMDLPGYILEKYIAGKELRYLILNGKIIAVHESKYGESVSETRDLERISYPESTWEPELMDLTRKTAAVMGLRYASVDYLIDAAGRAHILEVNSSPGIKWFHAPTSGPKVDVARMFLEAMLEDLYATAPQRTRPLGTYPAVAYS